MSRSVFCRRPSPFLVAFLALAGLFVTPQAHAVMISQEVTKAVFDAATKQTQEDQALFAKMQETADKTTQDVKNQLILLEKARVARAMKPAMDYRILASLTGVPIASAATEMLISTALEARYRELNLIPPGTGNTFDRGIADTTGGTLGADPRNFRIFMDYFCDPKAENGDMGKIGVDTAKRFQQIEQETGKPYVCAQERNKVLAVDGLENARLAGLPLKPHLLLFEPLTFPSQPTAGATQSNTNQMSDLIFGAYRYFERLVLGKAPSKFEMGNSSKQREAYVNRQGETARKMLASYPFAMLFAERVGTLVKPPPSANGAPDANAAINPAASAAALIRANWGPVSMDPSVLKLIENLENQPSMSMAQYLDILANKLPSSPMYLARIQQLSPEQLQREKIFLMGIQTVLRYQINRWMEVSTAIEAVD